MDNPNESLLTFLIEGFEPEFNNFALILLLNDHHGEVISVGFGQKDPNRRAEGPSD